MSSRERAIGPTSFKSVENIKAALSPRAQRERTTFKLPISYFCCKSFFIFSATLVTLNSALRSVALRLPGLLKSVLTLIIVASFDNNPDPVLQTLPWYLENTAQHTQFQKKRDASIKWWRLRQRVLIRRLLKSWPAHLSCSTHLITGMAGANNASTRDGKNPSLILRSAAARPRTSLCVFNQLMP